ncbi:MAG: hypothetical protein OHK0044_27390 [Burkholderiaceae bacterium]
MSDDAGRSRAEAVLEAIGRICGRHPVQLADRLRAEAATLAASFDTDLPRLLARDAHELFAQDHS